MSEIQDLVKNIITETETVLNRTLDNVYINTTIKVLLGLYAAFAAPKLPPTMVNLMDNIFVRIGFAFTIVLVATRDPSIALMVAVAFIITLQTANRNRLIQTNLSVAEKGQSSWLPSAKNKKVEGFNEEQVQQSEQNLNSQEVQDALAHPALRIPRNEDMSLMDASNPSNNLNKDQKNIEPEGSDQCAFTSADQLNSAQNNRVPNSNQKSCQSTFANQQCTQGLSENVPDGHNL